MEVKAMEAGSQAIRLDNQRISPEGGAAYRASVAAHKRDSSRGSSGNSLEADFNASVLRFADAVIGRDDRPTLAKSGHSHRAIRNALGAKMSPDRFRPAAGSRQIMGRRSRPVGMARNLDAAWPQALIGRDDLIQRSLGVTRQLGLGPVKKDTERLALWALADCRRCGQAGN